MKIYFPLCLVASILGATSAGAQPPDHPDANFAPGAHQPAPAVPNFDPVEEQKRQMARMTPEQTLKWLIATYNGGAPVMAMMARLVANADPAAPALADVQREFTKSRDELRIEIIDDMDVAEQGDEATATVHFTLVQRLGVRLPQVETLRLRREKTKWGDVWRIVPGQPQDIEKAHGFLSSLALYVAYPGAMLERLYSRQAMSKAKQLGLGVMQYTQDYDEKYAFTPETFRKAITPYVRSDAWSFEPNAAEAKSIFAFNPRLANISLQQVNDPARTVMLYLGHDGQLSFPFRDRTVICFADGHVKMVGKEAAQNLRWNP